jgi:hypothetical protein
MPHRAKIIFILTIVWCLFSSGCISQQREVLGKKEKREDIVGFGGSIPWGK